MNNLEIERKWVPVLWPPLVEPYDRLIIVQGYLMVDGPRALRLRCETTEMGIKFYTMTYKDSSGPETVELESYISEEQYLIFVPGVERWLAKDRYDMGDGVVYDCFNGTQWLIEKEFDTPEERDVFVAPEFYGKEVTGDHRYSNTTIAAEGFPP